MTENNKMIWNIPFVLFIFWLFLTSFDFRSAAEEKVLAAKKKKKKMLLEKQQKRNGDVAYLLVKGKIVSGIQGSSNFYYIITDTLYWALIWKIFVKHLFYKYILAQSTGAVEYTDCISAEG